MDHEARFAELTLDETTLNTPNGAMRVSEITRAEFAREVVRDAPGPSTSETSAPAVVGGAVLGGALFGTAGAVAGGLLGSTVKEDVPAAPTYHTNSVKIVFETSDLVYSMDIARDREMEANHFVQMVRKAVKRRGRL